MLGRRRCGSEVSELGADAMDHGEDELFNLLRLDLGFGEEFGGAEAKFGHLDLGDFAAQMPADCIKPIESIDGTRRILLKASEVERGMASGKPTVSLATIYQQVPEIFLRSIAPRGLEARAA